MAEGSGAMVMCMRCQKFETSEPLWIYQPTRERIERMCREYREERPREKVGERVFERERIGDIRMFPSSVFELKWDHSFAET